jgi:hypothetical protein
MPCIYWAMTGGIIKAFNRWLQRMRHDEDGVLIDGAEVYVKPCLPCPCHYPPFFFFHKVCFFDRLKALYAFHIDLYLEVIRKRF